MTSHASAKQILLLEKLVKEDEVLTWSARFKHSTKEKILEHWERAAKELNKHGPIKTGKRWRMSWYTKQRNKKIRDKKKSCTDGTIDLDTESQSSSSHFEQHQEPQEKNSDIPKAMQYSDVRHETVKYGDDNTFRKVIRAVSIGILYRNKTEFEVLDELSSTMGQNFYGQWSRMRLLILNKINLLLAVNDCEMQLEPENKMTVTEWLFFDTVLVHQNCDVIGMTDTTRDDRKCLVDLYELVERFNIESLVGDKLAEGWVAVTMNYNKENHHCTPMLLQRRWYQLKLLTQTRFHKYWSVYRGNSARLKVASKYQPTVLQQTIAKQHKSLIVNPVKPWFAMIKENLAILREHFQLIALNRAKGLVKTPTPPPENPWNRSVIIIGADMNTPQDKASSPDQEIRNIAMKLEQEMDIDIEENPPRAPIIQNTPTEISPSPTMQNTPTIQNTPSANDEINIKIEYESDNIEEHLPDEDILGMDTTEAIQSNPDNVLVKQEPNVAEISADPQVELPQITDVFGNVSIVDQTQLIAIRKYMTAQMSQGNQMGVKVIAGSNNIIDEGIQGKSGASVLDKTRHGNPVKYNDKFEEAVNFNDVNSIDDWIGQPDDFENYTDGDSTENEDIPEVDEKLIMAPVVYTVKLDDMDILPIRLPKTISDKKLLDSIHMRSKPIMKTKIAKSTIPQKHKVKNELKYTTEQLRKNPDFNITRKKLSPRFFSITPNRLLLRQCVPITIDVSKEFEKRLVNGRMYLNPSDLDRRIDLPASAAQNVPSSSRVVPTQVPEPGLAVPRPIVVPKLEAYGTIPIGPKSIPLVPAPIIVPKVEPSIPTLIPLIPNSVSVAPTNLTLQNKDGVITAVQYRSKVAPIVLPTRLPNAIISNIHPPPLVPIQMAGSAKILVPINMENITPTSAITIASNQGPTKIIDAVAPKKPLYYRSHRSEIKKTSFEFKVDDPKSLLPIESLDTILNVLTNVKELQRDVIQVSRDYDSDDDNNADAEENPSRKNQATVKSKTKRSKFCCWALERMNKIKNGNKKQQRSAIQHNCPYPRCNCCCKHKLAKYYDSIKEKSPSLVESEDDVSDESPVDPLSEENNSSIPDENKDSPKTFNVVFTLPKTNKNTVKIEPKDEEENNPKELQPLSPQPANTTTRKTIFKNLRQYNQIFLEKNKLLLTTAKFPNNFEMFEHYQVKMKQNLHLPDSVDIKLLPSGRMSVYKKRHAEISPTLLQELKDCVTIFHERCGIKTSPDTTSLKKGKTSQVFSKYTQLNNLGEAPTGSILRNILASSKPKSNQNNKTTFRFIKNLKFRSKIKYRIGIVLDKGLTPLQTLSQVKYACSVNGLFFKFDLKTNHLTPLNIRSKAKDFVPLIKAPKTVTEFDHHIPEETIKKLDGPNITDSKTAADSNTIQIESSDEEPAVKEIQITEKIRVGSQKKSCTPYNSILKSNIRNRTMRALRLVEELSQQLKKKQVVKQIVPTPTVEESSSESEENAIDDDDSDKDSINDDDSDDDVMHEDEAVVEVKEEIDFDEDADPLKLDEEDF